MSNKEFASSLTLVSLLFMFLVLFLVFDPENNPPETVIPDNPATSVPAPQKIVEGHVFTRK